MVAVIKRTIDLKSLDIMRQIVKEKRREKKKKKKNQSKIKETRLRSLEFTFGTDVQLLQYILQLYRIITYSTNFSNV